MNETVGRPGLGLLLRCVRGWLHDRAVWRAPCLEEPCTGFNGLLLSQVIKSFVNKGLGIFTFLRAPQIMQLVLGVSLPEGCADGSSSCIQNVEGSVKTENCLVA